MVQVMKTRFLWILIFGLSGCAHLGVFPARGKCPSTHPVKGNADSGYYHVPKDRFYHRVRPERCFRTTREAREAGFQPVPSP